MPELALPVETKPLSQLERVLDTFVAPSKTFRDLLRDASWWLPCLLMVLMAGVYSVTAVHKVGVARMSDNVLATMPRMQDMISNAKPADAETIRTKFQSNIKSQFYSSPLVLIAGGFAAAGLFLLTSNFAFGGRATYKSTLAMFWYSVLPMIVFYALVSSLLTGGVNLETFRVTNPLGTNPGYYLPDGSSPVLVAALSFLDIFSVWIFCLQAIGTSIVARISLGKAIGSVAIWWVLYSLLKILPAMLFS